MTHTFKVGDKGETADGAAYEVIAVHPSARQPVVAVIADGETLPIIRVFGSDGSYCLNDRMFTTNDLTPPKATKTFWVPLLRNPDTGGAFVSCVYNTRHEAVSGPKFKVIAVKEFAITEGEGMDE